ncbi:MAG: acetyl-CoA carboxylase carboxyl transferase subunit beta, partial [Zhenhengia sp.]
MLSALIGRQKKYAQTKTTQSKPEVPKGMYTKCPHCKKNIYVIDLIANIGVCTYCNGHLPISPSARISKLIDLDSFEEFDKEMKSANPLEFEGYEDKIETTMKKVEQNEAVITGKGRIGG